MASPFHELPGLRKYRDTVFEWRSLLHTPCYGFSGPNACYSSTCSHNPSSSESEKRIAKTKPSNLSKSSFKYNANARKSSNCERDVYQNAYKSSPTSHLTVKMRAFSYNQKTALDEYEYKMNGDDVYFNGIFSEQYIDLPVDCNQFCESPDYFSDSSDNLPFDETIQPDKPTDERMSLSSSLETVVQAKKYAFNPLSAPFHPTRNIYSNLSSPATLSANSSDCSVVEETSTHLQISTATAIKPPKKCSKDFICILCPKKYATLSELKEHVQNKVQKPHVCTICGMSYEHNYLLRRHFKNHRNLKSINCRGCCKKFRSLNQLNKHLETCPHKLYVFI